MERSETLGDGEIERSTSVVGTGALHGDLKGGLSLGGRRLEANVAVLPIAVSHRRFRREKGHLGLLSFPFSTPIEIGSVGVATGGEQRGQARSDARDAILAVGRRCRVWTVDGSSTGSGYARHI